MAKATSNINVRVDSELKKEAEDLFGDIGLSMSGAITLFLTAAVKTDGIPFELRRIPNKKTIEAIEEGRRIAHDPDEKGYNDIASLRAALEV